MMPIEKRLFHYRTPSIRYRVVSKKYVIEKKYCDYLVYIDPDEESTVYVLFVLSNEMNQCDSHLETFSKLLESFYWIGQDVREPTKSDSAGP
jgi:hypothetical protein